jgi:spore maturation protein CgeB
MHADLVLGLAQAPFTPDVLRELRQAGILTAFWFIEDSELFPYWKAFAPHFDHYFVIQKGDFLEQLNSAGCPRPYYLPLAADPDIHRPIELTPNEMEEFDSDISHVGAGYYNRRQLFPALLDYQFKLWGNDWEDSGSLRDVLQREGARLSTEETVKVFNATRININLHSSTYHEAVNPQGDFINPRTFEIAACGAFQLVDERLYLAENFRIGEEIATFANAGHLRDNVDHYLARPHERIQMAEAARRRILREHTYQHRLLELMGVIAGTHPQWTPRAGGLPSAEEIIREAGAESELGRVVQRFAGRGPLTLEDVSQEIERGGGNLSETEALILLLNEFRRWGLEKGVL